MPVRSGNESSTLHVLPKMAAERPIVGAGEASERNRGAVAGKASERGASSGHEEYKALSLRLGITMMRTIILPVSERHPHGTWSLKASPVPHLKQARSEQVRVEYSSVIYHCS